MEDTQLPSEFKLNSNWGVYKDAFEPQPPKHVVKGWERAPVAAHAPRLQGRKIWKRAASRAGKSSENDHTAQAELEMEGKGARKKMRMAGEKENIASAAWLPSKATGEYEVLPLSVEISPNKKTTHVAEGAGTDALLVPRKRTNTNHLITPRKPASTISASNTMGQESSRQGHTQSEHSPEKAPRRTKSLRKSTRVVKLEKVVDTQALAVNDEPTVMPAAQISLQATNDLQSPARNTPSVSLADTKTAEEQELVGNNDEALSSRMSIDGAEAVTQHTSSQATLDNTLASKSIDVALMGNCALSDIIAEDIGDPADNTLHDTDMNDGADIIAFNNDTETTGTLSPALAPHTADQIDADSIEEHLVLYSAAQSYVELTEETTTSSIAHLSGSDQPIIESTDLEAMSPAKALRTPKTAGNATPRTKKKTPLHSAARRSTRVTRGSTIQAEILPHGIESSSLVSSTQKFNPDGALGGTSSSTTESPSKTSRLKGLNSAGLQTRTPTKTKDVPTTATPQLPKLFNLEIPRTPNVQEELDLQLLGNDPISIIQAMKISTTDLIVTPQVEVKSTEETASRVLVDTAPAPPACLTTVGEQMLNPEVFTPTKVMITNTGMTPPIESIIIEQENMPVELGGEQMSEVRLTAVEDVESSTIPVSAEDIIDDYEDELSGDHQETSTPDPSTSDLVKAISKNASPAKEDVSDTDMLRSFLTRVKANKAAKAKSALPQRKRSLPHSPIQVPLGTEDNLMPSSPSEKLDFDVGPLTKKSKDNDPEGEGEMSEPRSIRRSGRTRLPVKAAPLVAPSFIPVRRLGQDGDSTVTLRRNEEKELAALTRVNTRKNKGAAIHPQEALQKQGEQKEGPAARQRALKEVFDEKIKKPGKRRKTVVWAEELVNFQVATDTRKVVVVGGLVEGGSEAEKEKATTEPTKKSRVPRVGIRGKMTLGMASNGTPAPKRKIRGAL